MPGHGSTECAVKAVSPVVRGRSEAESLDGAEVSQRMEFVMGGLVMWADDTCHFAAMESSATRGGAVRRG